MVLSPEETARVLGAVENPVYRLMLRTAYAAGLRVGEVVRLKVSDIDSARAWSSTCAKARARRIG